MSYFLLSKPTHRRSTSSVTLLPPAVVMFLLLLLALFPIMASAADNESCSTSENNQFTCPNCGGISVSDCTKCDGYLFTDYNYGICYDRKLFNQNADNGDSDNHYPFLWNDIVGTLVWFLTAGIATACGVGGGGIYVPMGILLLRFPPKASSGLSQASIFGASLGGIIINLRKRHPNEHIRDTKGAPLESHPGKIVSYDKDKGPAEIESDRQQYLNGGDGNRKFYTRPIIDFNMALFLAPMEMAGAVLGVIIQRLFPNWLFLILATLVLGFTCYKTFKKFAVSYTKDKSNREERRMLELRESEHPGKDKKSSGGNEDGNNANNGNAVATSDSVNANDKDEGEEVEVEMGNEEVQKNETAISATDDDKSIDDPKELEKRRQFLEDDARQYPKDKIAGLILLWAGLTVITFLKGGKGVDSVIGVTCEDAGFFVLLAAQFLWTFGFGAVFGFKNVKATQARLAVNYPFNEEDVLWDAKKLQLYSFITFMAGIVAGLIGIGGGMVLGPMMLVMGINPRVSTATTATMVLLTSSSVAVMFVLSGQVPWEYAAYFLSVCLVGAYIGKTKIDAYVKKTGMASILVGILATIIGLATVGCLIILFMNLAQVNWCLDGFKEFCTVTADEDKCSTAVRMLATTAEELFRY